MGELACDICGLSFKNKSGLESHRKFSKVCSVLGEITKEYKNGLSLCKLSKKFGVGHQKIAKALRKKGVSLRTHEEALRLSKTKRIPESAKTLTEEKGYLLGVLGPGDGYVHYEETDYYLALKVTDEDFADSFDEATQKIYEMKPRRALSFPNNRKMQYCVHIFSKKVVEDVLRYGKLEHFRHYTERVPERIKKSSREVKANYLKGFFDSQGGVGTRDIRAWKANLLLLEEIKTLLEDLGIASSIFCKKSNCQHPLYQIDISHKDNLEKFADSISFSIKRKSRKLESMVNSYERFQTPTQRVSKIVPLMQTLRESGWSYQKIADKLDLSRGAVRERVYDGRNLNKERSREIDRQVPQMVKLRESGLSYKQIAEELGTEGSVVWGRLNE